MWVGGELLGSADALEVGSVVLVLDVPAAELPWLARHPVGEWVGDQLRLGKRPMLWSYRPVGLPVWGPDQKQLVRFWTSADGTNHAVIDALRDRRSRTAPSPRVRLCPCENVTPFRRSPLGGRHGNVPNA
jgi:hypothetical protein